MPFLFNGHPNYGNPELNRSAYRRLGALILVASVLAPPVASQTKTCWRDHCESSAEGSRCWFRTEALKVQHPRVWEKDFNIEP